MGILYTGEPEQVEPQRNRPNSPHIEKIKRLVRSALPLLLLTAQPADTSVNKEEITSPETLVSKLTYERGNWKFDVMETKEETFQLAEGQKYFAHYIKDKLSKISGADLSYSKDLQTFTDAYIEITRKLNPTLNLDNPEEIVGQKVILPTTVLFTPKEGNFFRSRVGYEYLRDAAKADGMNISDESQREKIYGEACKLPIMPDSEYYECKNTDNDCKEACATHAQIVYGRLAKEFFEQSQGVKLVYNDLMRDEEGEKEIVKNGKGGTELGSTHITGGSLDQAVIWWIIDGVKIKYDDATDEQQADINNRLRPLLRKLLREYMDRGEILVMDETHGNIPHYHLYFPKNVTPLHPQEIKLNLSEKTQPSVEPKKPDTVKTFDEAKLLTREKDGTKFYTFTVPNKPLKYMLDLLCISSTEGTVEAIKQFNNKDHISPDDIIWIPVQFMKPELRDPTLLMIDDPKDVDQGILDLYNSNHEEGGEYRVPKALSKRK